ncbi:hypothetical protein HDU93_000307 [Gonapodya sp. JEL0774]|nr:hypothetical protein HDU93_000307 [Gonapodya sp. JEL0774]
MSQRRTPAQPKAVPTPPQQLRPLSSLSLTSAALLSSPIASLTRDPLTPKYPPHPGALRPREVLGGAHYSLVRTDGFKGPLLLAAASEAGAAALALLLPKTKEEKDEWAEILSAGKLLKNSQPFASNYAGYQLNVWNKQLGDGRVLTLGDIFTPPQNRPDQRRWEVQLKGAGKTPYSRTFDGLLTLAAGVREFVGCEALLRLNIPTAHVLSLTVPVLSMHPSTPSVPPCVLSRAASSFLRIGSYELHHHARDRTALKKLLDWTLENVAEFRWCNDDAKGWDTGLNRYGRFLREVVKRNAEMVAAWQAAAFVHGSLNSDNISVLGITLDLAGYTFLDAFDPDFTPNVAEHRFSQQPATVKRVLERFGEVLAQFVDDSGDVFEGDRRAAAVVAEFDERYEQHYVQLMRSKLGLVERAAPTDRPKAPDMLAFLLRCLERQSETRPQRTCDKVPTSSEVSTMWREWHRTYQARLHLEASPGTNMIESELARRQKMLAANPRIVPRGWILDEVIIDCEKYAMEGHEAAKRDEYERRRKEEQEPAADLERPLVLDDESSIPVHEGFLAPTIGDGDGTDRDNGDENSAPLFDGAVGRLTSISRHLEAHGRAARSEARMSELFYRDGVARIMRRALTLLVDDMFGELTESALEKGVVAIGGSVEMGVMDGVGLVKIFRRPAGEGEESELTVVETGYEDIKECREAAIRWAGEVPEGKLNQICSCAL